MGSIEIVSTGADLVTLDEAKRHLVVDHSDDDLLILSQITAARQWCEHRTSRFFTPTNVTLSRNGFDATMPLSHKPVQEVVSIVYDDSDTEDVSLALSTYELDKYHNCLRLAYGQSYPTARYHWNSVRITYRVGYYTPGSPEFVSVPEDVKRACLIVIGDLYEHREKQQVMQIYHNATADMLMANYRVYE